MNLQHVNIKLFLQDKVEIDFDKLFEVFHAWVAGQSMSELLIDVADYRHVPLGPGVLVVGHDADYALDEKAGRWGLLYNRKANVEGSNLDRFQQAYTSASHAASLLESELGLTFARRELKLFINDRALAPNTPETLKACRGDLEQFARETLGQSEFELEPETDVRQRFGVTYRLSQDLPLASATSS